MKTPPDPIVHIPDRLAGIESVAELAAVAKRLAERVAELEELLEQREAELHATDLARLENLSTVTAAEIISEAFLDGDALGVLEATP